jgi:hypothetical protein
MHVEKKLSCCGAAEFVGMNSGRFDPEKVMLVMGREGQYELDYPGDAHESFSHVLCTEAMNRGDTMDEPVNTLALKEWAEKMGLATVTLTEPMPNTNNGGGRWIQPCVVAINHGAMTTWFREQVEAGNVEAGATRLRHGPKGDWTMTGR